MNPLDFFNLINRVNDAGYVDEVDWAELLKPCKDSESFVCEYIWVVLNSGMKNQVAQKIYERVLTAIAERRSISEAFGHGGKVAAIEHVINNRELLWNEYQKADDKLAFCRSLPWIGDITKYHLAKNLGEDCIKPDRHLVRVAKKYGVDCFELCKKLSEQTGLRKRTVDTVIWRAANLGMI